jgi:hypothetical protein
MLFWGAAASSKKIGFPLFLQTGGKHDDDKLDFVRTPTKILRQGAAP